MTAKIWIETCKGPRGDQYVINFEVVEAPACQIVVREQSLKTGLRMLQTIDKTILAPGYVHVPQEANGKCAKKVCDDLPSARMYAHALAKMVNDYNFETRFERGPELVGEELPWVNVR